MGESMMPSNTDDGDCVGPRGPSRRSGRSSIGRPVQNSAAYPQLAKQTSALCASGVHRRLAYMFWRRVAHESRLALLNIKTDNKTISQIYFTVKYI